MENSLPLPTGVTIALNKVMPSANGSAGDPAIGFESDPSVGWYMDTEGNVVFTSGMDDTMLQNSNYTEFKKPIMFNEFEPDAINLVHKGILYKKPDDPGLWWLTEFGETNVAAGAAPPTMRMSQGTSAQPAFTFGSDCNSGLFLDSPGNVGVAAKGIEVVRFNKEMMKVFKPMEIMDSSVCNDPATPLTGYLYKKAGEPGLWWRSSDGEIDLTADLPASLQQPKGSAKIPTYTFLEDPDAGLYLIEPGRVGLSVNGSAKLEIKNSEIVADVPLRVPTGALSMPGITFSNNVKTGLFSTQSGHISMAAEGSKVFDVSQESVHTLVPLKVSSLVLANDVTTGLSGSKDHLDFNVGGKKKAFISQEGLHVSDILSLDKGLSMPHSTINEIDGSMSFISSGRTIMHLDPKGLHADVQVLAKSGTHIAPSYAFELAPNTGMFMEGGDLCLTGSSIKLKNKVELNGALQLPTGSLFTKPGQQGLYWQTSNGEVDLTIRGMSALPNKLELAPGGLSTPAYSFAGASTTGITLVNNALIQTVGGNAVISTDMQGMHLSGKFGIKDSSGAEVSLYKKPDSMDLFAKLPSSEEINLTNPITKYPIQVPAGKSIAFGGLLASATLDGIDLANSLKIKADAVQVNTKLEIKEQLQANASDSEHGVLYKEKGTQNLIWTAGGIHHNITKDLVDFKAQGNNDFKRPEFSFRNDLDTGLSKVEDNVVGLVAGGQLVLATAADQAMLYKPIAFVDTTSAPPAVPTEGKLYKKNGSKGLFWQTATDEIDLTQQQFPLVGPNGSAVNPTYAFQEAGYGLYKSGDMVGMTAGGQLVISARTGEAHVNGKLRITHDGQNGVVSIKNGNLYWNDTDLCDGMRYPIKAPDGDIAQPSYSFAGNTRLGITRVNDAITFVNHGSNIAQFTTVGMQTPMITTGKLNLDSNGVSGTLQQKGVDLVWKPTNGAEIVLGAPEDGFNGGIVGNDIDAPGFILNDYRMSVDNLNRFDISNNGQTVAKISSAGIQTNSVKMPVSTISDLNGIFTVEGAGGVIMRASENKIDFTADTIGIADGLLFKSGDSIIWQTDLGPVDLTDKTTTFPLKAPLSVLNNEVAYGYIGSNVGIAKDGNALVLKSENAYAVLEDDGYITSIGLNAGQICAADGLVIMANGIPTKLTKDKFETSGIIRGRKDAITFGYDAADYSVGISQINGSLGLVSGKATPTVLTDSSLNIKHRNLAFDDAILERRGSNLYWKVGSDEVHITKPHEEWYRETLTYTTAGNIRKGDIVCMDPAGSGKIYKGIGGLIQKVPTIASYTGNCKAMNVFDYDASNYVLAFTKVKLIGSRTHIVAVLLLMSKETQQIYKTYELVLTSNEYSTVGVLEDGYGKILQIDIDTYIIPFMKPGDNTVNIIKLRIPFSMTPEKSTLSVEMGVVCESMTAEYDNNNDCLVIVCHSSTTQNFAVALISAGRTNDSMTLGTVETMLSNLSVADINKQIHLVLVPGGTCVVSYGIMKMVFIISSHQGSITPGDAFMDYESIDCAGMFYDTNNGVIMTLEKTVSGSCYLQILDVLGIAIQKMTSKGFNNANIEPLGIAYNHLSGNYAILYATGGSAVPVYIQTFDFDGELIAMGLRYQDQNGIYEPTGPIKHEKNLFEIPGTKLFIYGYDPNILSTFEAGYHGNPSGYLGVANTDAAMGQICKVTVKGHIYYGDHLSTNWLGKKLYITDPAKNYPECLSTQSSHGVFFGTCLDSNRVLLGL